MKGLRILATLLAVARLAGGQVELTWGVAPGPPGPTPPTDLAPGGGTDTDYRVHVITGGTGVLAVAGADAPTVTFANGTNTLTFVGGAAFTNWLATNAYVRAVSLSESTSNAASIAAGTLTLIVKTNYTGGAADGNTTNHADLLASSLIWSNSAHTGTADTLAGFDAAGAATGVVAGTGISIAGGVISATGGGGISGATATQIVSQAAMPMSYYDAGAATVWTAVIDLASAPYPARHYVMSSNCALTVVMTNSPALATQYVAEVDVWLACWGTNVSVELRADAPILGWNLIDYELQGLHLLKWRRGNGTWEVDQPFPPSPLGLEAYDILAWYHCGERTIDTVGRAATDTLLTDRAGSRNMSAYGYGPTKLIGMGGINLDGVDDYAYRIISPWVIPIDTNISWAISAWLTTDQLGAGPYALGGESQGAGVLDYAWWVNIASAKPQLLYRANATSYTATSTGTVASATWFHFMGVCNRALHKTIVYVDGSWQGSTSISAAPQFPADSAVQLVWGTLPWLTVPTSGMTQEWDGKVFNIMIFRRRDGAPPGAADAAFLANRYPPPQ